MASARIISHSPQSWRDLALDLLTRGYTVEIVSPDKIPGHVADLELRVDADGASRAPRNVAILDGGHPRSPNFAQLKASTNHVGQRTREARGVTPFPARAVNFDAGPRLLGEGWFWRALAGFAAVIVLASALVTGVRRTDGPSLAQNPGTALQNITAAVDTNSVAVPKPEPTAVRADRKNPSAAVPARVEGVAQTALPKAELSQGNFRVEPSLHRTDDLRVAAAIIDRDKLPATFATQSSALKRRHNQDDVIAPDTVTYLDGAVTAKAGVH